MSMFPSSVCQSILSQSYAAVKKNNKNIGNSVALHFLQNVFALLTSCFGPSHFVVPPSHFGFCGILIRQAKCNYPAQDFGIRRFDALQSLIYSIHNGRQLKLIPLSMWWIMMFGPSGLLSLEALAPLFRLESPPGGACTIAPCGLKGPMPILSSEDGRTIAMGLI